MRVFTPYLLVALLALSCAPRPSAAPPPAPGERSTGRATVAPTDSLPGVVQGVVRDSASGAPLVGVQVMLLGTAAGALTDAAGQYVLPVWPAGRYVLRARRVGHRVTTVPLELAPGRGAVVDVWLPESGLQLRAPRTNQLARPRPNGALQLPRRYAHEVVP